MTSIGISVSSVDISINSINISTSSAGISARQSLYVNILVLIQEALFIDL